MAVKFTCTHRTPCSATVFVLGDLLSRHYDLSFLWNVADPPFQNRAVLGFENISTRSATKILYFVSSTEKLLEREDVALHTGLQIHPHDESNDFASCCTRKVARKMRRCHVGYQVYILRADDPRMQVR